MANLSTDHFLFRWIPLRGEIWHPIQPIPFWQKNSLITLILFELWLLWYVVQSQIHWITLYLIFTTWSFISVNHGLQNFYISCKAWNSTTINLRLALPSSISWKILLDGSVVWKSQKPKVNRGGCLDFWRLLTPFTGLFWKLFEGRNITKLKLDITSKAIV